MSQEGVIRINYNYWKAVAGNISLTRGINRTINGLFICGPQFESNIRNALNKLL